MTLTINSSDQAQLFKLGDSLPAKMAIQCYQRYLKGHQYEDLKNCFGNLYVIVQEAPSRKLEACKATNALAFSVYTNPEMNCYRKHFIAISVSSIINFAGLRETLSQIKKIWDISIILSGQEMRKNELDPQAAEEAGIAIISTTEEEAKMRGFEVIKGKKV